MIVVVRFASGCLLRLQVALCGPYTWHLARCCMASGCVIHLSDLIEVLNWSYLSQHNHVLQSPVQKFIRCCRVGGGSTLDRILHQCDRITDFLLLLCFLSAPQDLHNNGYLLVADPLRIFTHFTAPPRRSAPQIHRPWYWQWSVGMRLRSQWLSSCFN